MRVRAIHHQLSSQAVHIDFLRLRCGSEETFLNGVQEVRGAKNADAIHPFIAFSEWDALVVVPCSHLYPPTLTDLYSNGDVAASVSGTFGYFAYLWDHDVNDHWQETLAALNESGPTILMSLRFADWFRQEAGLGSEILFLDRVKGLLEHFAGAQAIVCHSLGWNDVILLVHARRNGGRLMSILKHLRLMTLADCIQGRDVSFSQRPEAQIFAASYSHLLGSFESYIAGNLSFGSLSRQIKSARLLVRVAPPHEQTVRLLMQQQAIEIGTAHVDSEMGHYSLSVDFSDTAREKGGRGAIQFIKAARQFIGNLGIGGQPDSYAETTSIFRFEEDPAEEAPPQHVRDDAIEADIATVKQLLATVPALLRDRGASSMTSHRFVSALTTLLDHLFDPVRSSVVRHLSRFAASLPNRLRELNVDGIDDLCHVLEYAIGQAIDGIAQFQHDANALGLSGRGGYSRLIAAVEWYIQSAVVGLGIKTELPLITFGLRTGNAGSTGRYQIDIPFNVLFAPSRWHVILHEIGHLAWLHEFGWMMESLAMYRAMEREIRIEIKHEIQKGTLLAKALGNRPTEQVQIEFLRTRELVRELFPSYLTFALACAGRIEEYDELALRPMMKGSHSSAYSRTLLLRVVTHCVLEIMQAQLDKQTAGRQPAERAATWWGVWSTLLKESVENTDARIVEATSSIHDSLLRVDEEMRARESRQGSLREGDGGGAVSLDPKLAACLAILHSDTFKVSVREALHSVVTVLSLRGRHFESFDSLGFGPAEFGELLENIDAFRRVDSDEEYELWLGRPFAEWLNSGEVLTRHREAFDWSRLLMASRVQLMEGDKSAFMRAQLSVLLSMWHAATTEGHREYEELDELLFQLGVVREMKAVLAVKPQKRLARRMRRQKANTKR